MFKWSVFKTNHLYMFRHVFFAKKQRAVFQRKKSGENFNLPGTPCWWPQRHLHGTAADFASRRFVFLFFFGLPCCWWQKEAAKSDENRLAVQKSRKCVVSEDFIITNEEKIKPTTAFRELIQASKVANLCSFLKQRLVMVPIWAVFRCCFDIFQNVKIEGPGSWPSCSLKTLDFASKVWSLDSSTL